MQKVMKQTLYAIIMFPIAVLTAACVQDIREDEDKPESHQGNFTLAVNMEASRSTLDGLSPKWVEGDAISAINATGNYKLWLIDAENGVFSGDVQGTYPFLITYPYSEDYSAGSYSAGTATLSIPATQTLAYSQNVAPGALVAAEVLTSGNTITLKNLVSLVKLTVLRSDLTSISLSSTEEGEALCGSVRLDPSDPDDGISVTSGSDTVTLLPEGDCFDPGTYYLSVVPRDVSGVSFSFTKSNGSTAYTREKEASTTFSRSGSLNFGNFFEPTVISTKAELIAWKNSRGTWTEWDFVKIGADIDLEGDYWPGVNFSGELDGDSHSITNIRIENSAKWVCFFSTVTGFIHDLTLGSSSDNSYFTSTLDDANEGYVAPVGQVNGGRLKNITNYVPVEASGTAISCAAGICAYYYSGQTAEGLVNRASVSISSDAQASTCNLGGVIAATRGGVDCEFSACENYGTVSFTGTSSSDLRIGGIIATLNPASSQSHHLTDCENNGNILITSTASISNSLYLGGVIGYCNSASYPVYLSGCNNNATVANRAGSCSSSFSGGGIVGKLSSQAQVTDCSTSSGALMENTAEGNRIWIGGIAGETLGASFSGCTNDGSVRNTGNSTYASSEANADISVGGIVGTVGTTGATFNSCENSGTVSSSGNVYTASNPVSVGGIAGADYGGASYSSCSNTGALTTSISSSPVAYVSTGGILGRNNYRKASLASCTNTGNISTSGGSAGCFFDNGGIVGYGGTCGTDISSSRSNCTISNSATGNIRPGMAFGRILGTSSCTIQSTGIAGSVHGVTITSSNWSNQYILYSVIGAATTLDISGGANSCYFIK